MASKMKQGTKRKKDEKEVEELPSDESEMEFEEFQDADDDSDIDDEEFEGDDEEESDDDSDVDISQMNDNIALKDVSDDEAIGDDASGSDDDEIFSKVLEHNDSHLNTINNNVNKTNTSQHQANTASISNELQPTDSSENQVAIADEYEHDSSDEEEVLNTIGNIPYEWYKEYAHIGYDKEGRKIIKPPREDEIDEFLRKMEDPMYWRTVRDPTTGQSVILTDEDVDFVKRIQNAKNPDPTYDPYAPFIDFFTHEKSIHPVHNRPEHKASFIPSLAEKRIVSKLVSAIKKARLNPKPKPKKDKPFTFNYDLWETEVKLKRHNYYIAAPKLKPPGHEESYNPPKEYLFTEEEKKKWEESEPEERKLNFIPQSYKSLRQVPAYPRFVQERFERSLDLYLCPRIRKKRINVRAEDLIPELPKPADLQPFPSQHSMAYNGHSGKVTSVSVEPSGQFIASGDEEGNLKVFEVLTSRCFKTIAFDGKIESVAWFPNTQKSLVAVVAGQRLYLLNIGLGHKQTITNTDELFDVDVDIEIEKSDVAEWTLVKKDSDDYKNRGIRAIIQHKSDVSGFCWHSGGEYFATVMPSGANKSVAIHHLSKRRSQVPFKRSKDIIITVRFHPSKPHFFVATKKSVRVYDLIKQDLVKKLTIMTSEISSLAIHPGGDNVLIGGVDPKVQWFDMDLSTKAYKVMRYHKRSIRQVDYHRRFPIFASASDDGTIVISHGMVHDDLSTNALIVPVKVLKTPKSSAPFLDCQFHTIQPWIFGCSSDTVRLFT